MPDPSLELIGLCGRAITVLVHAVRQVAEIKRCSLEEIENALQDRTAPTTAASEGAR